MQFGAIRKEHFVKGVTYKTKKIPGTKFWRKSSPMKLGITLIDSRHVISGNTHEHIGPLT